MKSREQEEYLPILEEIAAGLSERAGFTYGEVRPLLLDRNLSPQIAWPVFRKRFLQVVERRKRQQGHVYRVKDLRGPDELLDQPLSAAQQRDAPQLRSVSSPETLPQPQHCLS